MSQQIQEIISQTSNVVLDKQPEIRLALACMLARGHLLIEDVPGVGKTTMVQALGRLSGLETKRIQFTIDLLPADILGGQIYRSKEDKFEFHQGPIFCQLLLADELNRASPRTQGALLQAMEENQVSVDGQTYDLPHPFLVIATQNPHQQMGTFPLPESQLDRFLMSLELNYASKMTEIEIFKQADRKNLLDGLKSLLSAADFISLQKKVDQVLVSDKVALYVSDLLDRSRRPKHDDALPLSTRAGLALIRMAKAWAFLDNRNYLQAEDIQAVLVPVLGHRMGGNHGLRKGRQWALALQKDTPVAF